MKTYFIENRILYSIRQTYILVISLRFKSTSNKTISKMISIKNKSITSPSTFSNNSLYLTSHFFLLNFLIKAICLKRQR